MFWLKACPRCKGDLYLDVSSRGKDIVCLQCGYRRYILTLGDSRAGGGYKYAIHTPRYKEHTEHRVPITL
jgi:hypothetical protein